MPARVVMTYVSKCVSGRVESSVRVCDNQLVHRLRICRSRYFSELTCLDIAPCRQSDMKTWRSPVSDVRSERRHSPASSSFSQADGR